MFDNMLWAESSVKVRFSSIFDRYPVLAVAFGTKMIPSFRTRLDFWLAFAHVPKLKTGFGAPHDKINMQSRHSWFWLQILPLCLACAQGGDTFIRLAPIITLDCEMLRGSRVTD
jgi:hypothetical protein